MLQNLRLFFSAKEREARLQAELDKLRQHTPIPVFWLFGRTQTGKTSVVKYLTGAEEAEIGQGFRPCTRFSRRYEFPTAEAPLLTFLDTRGLDEPGYDPAEDLAEFGASTHVIVVTAKIMDHALENVRRHLETIRKADPHRPVLLLLTCLHEAYPQQQHPQPYPFHPIRAGTEPPENATARDPLGLLAFDPAQVSEALVRSLTEHEQCFTGLVDRVVPVDLTRPEEGFNEPNYGGSLLKAELLEILPVAYRQTLLALDEASRALQDVYARNALPHIVGYSALATTAGAIPIPLLSLLVLPAIQTRLICHLAQLYGQPLTAARFLELAGTLGLGMAVRQAAREVMKFIPYVGSVAGAALAGASTFALGKAFCYYYSSVHKGHIPRPEDLRRYYQEQLVEAERAWKAVRADARTEDAAASSAAPEEKP